MSQLHKDLKDGMNVMNITNLVNAKKTLNELFEMHGKKSEEDSTNEFDLFAYQLVYKFVIGNANEDETKQVIKIIENEKNKDHLSVKDALQLIEVGTEMSKKENRKTENFYKQYFTPGQNVITTIPDNTKITYPYCGKSYGVLNENEIQ